MGQGSSTYYNGFFEEYDPGRSFEESPHLRNLTRTDILGKVGESGCWTKVARFYFLPFLLECYRFTRQNRLPHFALMTSPSMLFQRDRLDMRMHPSTLHSIFFATMDMCGLLDEKILLLVEKRFHITRPISGGTQQLYNMLWDYDLRPFPQRCVLPQEHGTDYFNPSMEGLSDIWLSRSTTWLIDDLNMLCSRYELDDQFKQTLAQMAAGGYTSTEVLDLSGVPESKRHLYRPRELHFKVFVPRDVPEPQPEPAISSLSDLTDDDSFDFDSTQRGLIDSTLDFDKEDEEMNRIISFFANMPKVTSLVQGMLDMMTGLSSILPLVMQKIDDPKLNDVLRRTVDMLAKGTDKVLKICRFLGIKVQKKQSGAVSAIVKDRFKKDRKEFIEYEIEELNKTIDALEEIDEDKSMPVVHPGDIPPDITPNNLYPQRMPARRPHIHLADEHGLTPHICHCDRPMSPHDPVQGLEDRPLPPCPPAPGPQPVPPAPGPIPSVSPEPPEQPPMDVNGIK